MIETKFHDGKIFINVPYDEKDQAKYLGARWDHNNKKWYIYNIDRIYLFSKWLENRTVIDDGIINKPNYNVKSNKFYLAESLRKCWKCSKDTKVFGILLREYLSTFDIEVQAINHEVIYFNTGCFLAVISEINSNVINEINNITKTYYFDYSKTEAKRYLINHCEFCKSIQGDYFLFSDETNGCFCSEIEDSCRSIKFHNIQCEIIAVANIFATASLDLYKI